MSRVVLCSAMRNAAQHVPRYFQQVAGLYLALAALGMTPYLLIGEGDSTDATRPMLIEAMRQTGLAGKLIDTTHGGPSFGPVENRQRFAQLAGVYNTLWLHIPADAEAVIFVEGDLIWRPHTLAVLVARLTLYPAVAPMVMHAPGCTLYGDPQGRWFYDTWAFRLGGQRFSNRPPYHPDVNGGATCGAVPLDSAGSCIAMRAEVAASAYFPPDDMVLGMTRQLAAQGTPVYLQPDLEVEHPNG